MRYKVVPEPRSLDALLEARAALPLVPGSVEDCCTRIRDRTDWRSRDEAREVLTLLVALGLAGESDRGFHRTREDSNDAELAARFREAVFGVRELTAALAAGPLTPDEAFERLREVVPKWERDRYPDWRSEWRERTRRLLEWGVAFGMFQRNGDAFRLAESKS